jgi:FtsZ-interacting cell division protein ZipA
LRRQRHARGESLTQGREGERVTPTFDGGGDSGRETHEGSRSEGRVYREPTLTFPEMHTGARGDGRIEPRDRDPVSNPPVVELDERSLAGLKVDRQQVVDEFTTQAFTVDDESRDSERDDFREPTVEGTRDEESEEALEAQRDEELDDERDDAADDERIDEREAPPGLARARVEPLVPELSPAAATRSSDPGAPAIPVFQDPSLVAHDPIVDWPAEETRRIIALRLVSGASERFAGRAVRLALAAEGFVLGKFDIFHKPGPDGRAVLSAASLTKPGTFALSTMDAQRFGGISLFAVLPGPLPALQTFDELLITSRSLNDRLRGALQDERGEPLTPVRSASLRESLSAAAAAPVVGPPAGGSTPPPSPGDSSPH